MNDSDIVAVSFGAYVTNDPQSIATYMAEGFAPRLITRQLAVTLAGIFQTDNWKNLADAAALATSDELIASVPAEVATEAPAPAGEVVTAKPKRIRKPKADSPQGPSKPKKSRTKKPVAALPTDPGDAA